MRRKAFKRFFYILLLFLFISSDTEANEKEFSDETYAFFAENSAELNIEETRDTLLRISQFLSMPELAGRNFRIEGHTDSTTADSTKWPSNWELSSARAVNVLHYLSDFGINESQFSASAGTTTSKSTFERTSTAKDREPYAAKSSISTLSLSRTI